MTGKLRSIANALFLILTLVGAPQVDALGFDPYVHLRVALIFVVVHVIDGVLALVLWRVARKPRRMRQLTFASVVLETTSVVFASWIYGAVNAPHLFIALVFVSIYRLGFDFRVGVTAFVIVVGGLWAVVVAECVGVLPHQPIALGAIDGVYGTAAREIGAMTLITIATALTFATASWAVGRVRHRELAIRLLRDSLRAADRGKVGRHTGRTLRDTYTLGSLIGTGGMGEVYRGTHLRTGREVAVKILHGHLLEDPAVLTRFRREAEVTAKLGSEHIVGVIDIDVDDTDPFMVLELMEGENLSTRIARGPLAFTEVADIVEQIARGLAVAHRAGVVHRDLKPENLFLCPGSAGRTIVKILDFGVLKLGNATAITRDAAMLGTPDYMSPEQADGQADSVAAAADIFALGGVAYTALTGKRPFEAESVPVVLRRICDDDPTPLREHRADIPPGTQAVLSIALAKDPELRHASAIEFATQLAAALAGTVDPTIEARARTIKPGDSPPKRRHRATTIEEYRAVTD